MPEGLDFKREGGDGVEPATKQQASAPPAGALEFVRLTVALVLAEADALARRHWRELYGEAPYLPKLDRIVALEERGGFAYYAVRKAGEIVGHVGMIVLDSPFHDCLVALDAFYYVEPGARRGGTAARLLRFAGEDLTARGVETVLMSCMEGSGLDSLIGRAGYERVSRMFKFTGK